MADWQRSTVESSYGDLAPEVRASLEAYAEKHELGDVGADATFCAVTISERKKLFGRRRQTVSVVATPAHLLWTLGEGGDVTTVGVRRSEVEIREFRSDLVQDTGIEVFGFVPMGAPERATAFIGLGPEAAGQKLREALA